MFSDPVSLNYGATPMSLPRISMKDGASIYRTPGGECTLTISHALAKNRLRFLCRLDQRHEGEVIATGQSSGMKCSAYLVVDVPSPAAYTVDPTLISGMCENLIEFLTAESNAALIKVLGWET